MSIREGIPGLTGIIHVPENHYHKSSRGESGKSCDSSGQSGARYAFSFATLPRLPVSRHSPRNQRDQRHSTSPGVTAPRGRRIMIDPGLYNGEIMKYSAAYQPTGAMRACLRQERNYPSSFPSASTCSTSCTSSSSAPILFSSDGSKAASPSLSPSSSAISSAKGSSTARKNRRKRPGKHRQRTIHHCSVDSAGIISYLPRITKLVSELSEAMIPEQIRKNT